MDGWWAAMMFGAIVSATDPVAVVAVLQTLGAQPKLSHMIEGESLLNDGTAVVIFLVFKGLMLHNIQEFGTSTTILKMVGLVLRLAGGGVLLGIVFSYAVYAWLRASRNMTANIEISIMVLSVYLVFYLSEHVFGASGVLATVVYGLSLAKRKHLAMTVPTAEQNEVVWQEIGYVANSFTF
jgi:NhaP-type Na+/H+ or K+/H+ antiporter